jgi:hypothetical protein
MTTKNKVLLTIVVIAICGVLIALVMFGYISAEPLVGLLGVVIGVLMSEYSHKQSAREDRRNQLRLAALDRRLQAHQDAYSLWRRILKDLDTAKIGDTVMECQEWWNNNCLYLTPDARQAFVQAYLTASSRAVVMGSRDVNLISREFEIIKRAGELIAQGVELPIINEGEDKLV